MTTVVSSFARGGEYGFEYIQLSVVCDGGELDLVVDDDEFHFYNTPGEVTLRVDAGAPQTFRWPRFRGAASGFSPANDRALIRLLQSAEQVTIQLKEGSTTTAQVVDLVGFFSTPAQPNIEHCGASAPSGVSLLGDTSGEIKINIEYTVTADAADGILTTVVETRVSNESYSSSYIYLVCDSGRFDVVLYITDGTYSTPSWTPTTTVRVDDGAAQEFRWPNIRGVENGISPDDDFAFVDRIRMAKSLDVSVNHGTAAAGTTFGLTGLLSTRAQGNVGLLRPVLAPESKITHVEGVPGAYVGGVALLVKLGFILSIGEGDDEQAGGNARTDTCHRPRNAAETVEPRS